MHSRQQTGVTLRSLVVRHTISAVIVFTGATTSMTANSAALASGAASHRPPSSTRIGCAANLANELTATGDATELITVQSAGPRTSSAELQAWTRSGECFSAAGSAVFAELGSAGISTHHIEGDGTTPAGRYLIGETMYGVLPNPGVRYRYHQLVCGDWWDEDSSSPTYNQFEHVECGVAPPFHGASESLWTEAPDYDYLAVIEYNVAPAVSGRGSGIFLHVSTGIATTGCIAIASPELVKLLRWLSPSRHPVIIIGTTATIRRY